MVAHSEGVYEVRVDPTSSLEPAVLDSAKALCAAEYVSFTDDDWEHGLGGLHAIAWDGDLLVGHAAVAQRRLLHRGRALRCGYVENVVVRSSHRRQGIATALMSEIGAVIARGFDVGGLAAGEDGARVYRPLGWRKWRGPTFALTPAGVVRTPDDDAEIYVLPGAYELDLDAELTCDWRDGDVW